MLIIHIRNLEKTALARLIYEEQKKQCWPGLALETSAICKDLQIEDCNITKLSKEQYSKVVNVACHTKNEKTMREQARGKCERIQHEEYGRKEYISQKNIQDVRQQYRSRFGLQPFAGNYSKDKRFARTNWLCRCKEEREEETHLMSGQCTVFGDLALKYNDLTDDENLVQFFSEVLARRDELDKE